MEEEDEHQFFFFLKNAVIGAHLAPVGTVWAPWRPERAHGPHMGAIWAPNGHHMGAIPESGAHCAPTGTPGAPFATFFYFNST